MAEWIGKQLSGMPILVQLAAIVIIFVTTLELVSVGWLGEGPLLYFWRKKHGKK